MADDLCGRIEELEHGRQNEDKRAPSHSQLRTKRTIRKQKPRNVAKDPKFGHFRGNREGRKAAKRQSEVRQEQY